MSTFSQAQTPGEFKEWTKLISPNGTKLCGTVKTPAKALEIYYFQMSEEIQNFYQFLAATAL